jgi:hypothetical protein
MMSLFTPDENAAVSADTTGIPHRQPVFKRPPAFNTAAEMCNWHQTQISAACKARTSTAELLAVLTLAVSDLLTAFALEQNRRFGQ